MTGRIVIVGGGITGLAALEHITRVAPNTSVILLESSPRLGGHIRSERHEGFVMEAGPDVILSAKPAAIELAKRVGLGDRLQGTNPDVKGSYILSDGRLRRVPDGLTGLVPSKFGPFVTTPVISAFGKLRVGLEYLIPPRRESTDESIEDFVVRRLGIEMYERLVEPLLSGISAGDGSCLSISAMFPQLVAFERDHGGLIRGMLASKKKRASAKQTPNQSPLSPFISFPNGLEELVTATAGIAYLRGAEVRTDAPVAHVAARSDEPGYELTLASGEVLPADAIVLATPAHAAGYLLRDLDQSLSRKLASVEYASTATISLAYPASAVTRPLDATGYVVPKREGRDVLACTWTSAKFTGRAPANHVLFRVFLGGAARVRPDLLSDDALLEIAQAELRSVVGVSATPELVRLNRFDRALPQYTVGHTERVAAITAAAARHPGLELAGAVYRGVGIPDCVQSGIEAATRALAAAQSSTPILASSAV